MKICKHKDCSKKIEKGRSDKEYCNNNHKSANNYQIDKMLFPKFNKQVANSKSTYKCLLELYPLSLGTNPISIKTMYEHKFRDDICYNVVKDSTLENVLWFCIQDYGFRQLSETEFLIQKFSES